MMPTSMIRFLTLFLVVTAALAWDPHLKIAEKIAIPHHIRHNYEYPEINLRDIGRRVIQNNQQGFSQLSGPSQPVQPSRGLQSQPFESGPAFQSQQGFEPSRNFPSPSLDQSRGFRSSPGQNTRFFNLGTQRSGSLLDFRS